MVRTWGSSSTTRMRAVRHWRSEARSSACARDADTGGTTCGLTKFNAKPGSSPLFRRRSGWRIKKNGKNAAHCHGPVFERADRCRVQIRFIKPELSRSAREARRNLPKTVDGCYFGARSNSCHDSGPVLPSIGISQGREVARCRSNQEKFLPVLGLELAAGFA